MERRYIYKEERGREKERNKRVKRKNTNKGKREGMKESKIMEKKVERKENNLSFLCRVSVSRTFADLRSRGPSVSRTFGQLVRPRSCGAQFDP